MIACAFPWKKNILEAFSDHSNPLLSLLRNPHTHFVNTVSLCILIMMVYTCNGCTASFTRHGGLVQHLQQSPEPACQRARREYEESTRRPTRLASHRRASRSAAGRRRASRSRSRDSASATTAPSDTSADEGPVHVDDNPVPFEGDYFGGADDYNANDLPFDEEPMDVDPSSHDAAEESSDDEGSDDDAVGRDIVQPLPDLCYEYQDARPLHPGTCDIHLTLPSLGPVPSPFQPPPPT
ncbi:hypothetical protein C8Q72DRAFT_822270 [Fomitopsis betulina]|nr:hypothetical protein C8Q72DRAFT_822270 [Fomitopsis betulina]